MVYVYRCCVPNCNQTSKLQKMYCFPRFESIYKEWIKRIANEKLTNMDWMKVRKRYRVCDIHFTENCRIDKMYQDRSGLLRTSLPTLYLPGFTDTPTSENSIMLLSKNYKLFISETSPTNQDSGETTVVSTPILQDPLHIDTDKVSKQEKVGERSNTIVTFAKSYITYNRKLVKKPCCYEVTNEKKGNNEKNCHTQITVANTTVMDLSNDTPCNDNCSVAIPIADITSDSSYDALAGNKDNICLTPENISTICRICLKETGVMNLKESTHKKQTYAELLEICFTITLQEDPALSLNICLDCSRELLKAYNFREKCSASQETLNHFKKSLQNSQKQETIASELQENQTVKEEEERSRTRTKRSDKGNIMRAQENKKITRRFYLIKAGLGGKKCLQFKEIDKGNATTILNDRERKPIYMRVDNAASKVTAGVLPPGKGAEEVIGRSSPYTNVRRMNKRKMRAYTELIRPAILNSFGKAYRKTVTLSRKPYKFPGICGVCQTPYSTSHEYRQHAIDTKHYQDPYACVHCGKVFSSMSRLNTHLKSIHTRLHMCDICGKCYKTAAYLSIHLKSHSKTGHVCKRCGSSFSTHGDVLRHSRRDHPGAGTYYCMLCYRVYRNEAVMLEHIKTRHPGLNQNTKEEDEIRAIDCGYCDEICQNKLRYSLHLSEDHEANACIYCDTLFDEAEELDDHMRDTHGDIPDFSCRYCGRIFQNALSLYAHAGSHSPSSSMQLVS